MKREINFEFFSTLKEEYEAGAHFEELSKKYHTDAHYAFRKFGYKGRSGEALTTWRKTHRRQCSYILNWDCSKISKEEEAYIIGIMMADGHISGNQTGIKLKKSDKTLVEKIKNYFSEEIKLQQDENSSHFVVSSLQVCENMEKLGVLRHKTLKELHIPEMPKVLIRHFVRGYFDGDGSIFLSKVRPSNPYFKSYICSPTKNILQEIQKELALYNIESTINVERRENKVYKILGKEVISSTDMYRLFIRKKDSIERFYNYLYKDSTIYLERKFKIFNDNLELFKYKKKKHANTELT